ncbi:uncharacterized protein LOC121600908 [Anopheles merus]|uniref:uncharacterized protein LOC121600908 n=1 Tax=Anopheles merus TaxID=30066 RepID=UPI001BE41919|nr:uncharacterized protein LOC121600908 [Anopheles merus]XP_041785615.1 uncharacterized protein LOC121600908 [Anopheles merus]XP_041785616.1 uncharacterized protein LOC121600908 [Anopheles merus]
MASDPRLPQPLDCDNLAKEWPRWKQSFAIYLRASGKITEKEENKVATFLWTIGPRGVEIFNTLYPDAANAANLFGENESEVEDEGVADAAEEEGEAMSLKKVIAAFDDYCLPKRNAAMEAFKFHKIAQKEKQTFAEFETELRTQAQFCEFQCLKCNTPYTDRMLRDRIIIGINDKSLQHKLLDRHDATLNKVVETCKLFEVTSDNKQVLEEKLSLHEVKKEERQSEDERQVAAVNCMSD